MGKKIIGEIRENAIKRVENGERKMAVAKDLGVSVNALDRWTKHVPRVHPNRNSQSVKDEAFRRVRAGESRNLVARTLGISVAAANRYAAGLPRTANGKPLDYPDGVVRTAIARLKKGDKYRDVAADAGVTVMVLIGWAKAENLPKRRVFNLPEEVREEAVTRVQAGEKKIVVARDLGLSETRIHALTKEIKLNKDKVPDPIVKLYLDRIAKGEHGTVVARSLGINPSTLGRHGRALTAQVSAEVSAKVKREILAAHKKGKSITSIAKQLTLAKGVVTKIVGKATGKNLTQRYTEKQKHDAVRSLEAGEFAKDIARRLGCSVGAISIWHKEAVSAGKAKKINKHKPENEDREFEWVMRDYPDYSDWVPAMTDWLALQIDAYEPSMRALSLFIKRYLHGYRLPTTRAEMLRKDSVVPNFFATCCAQSSGGVSNNNHIHRFIEYVLNTPDFSETEDDSGVPIRSDIFRNPIPIITGVGKKYMTLRESVRNTLPYAYISDLREMIVQGPNFRDWVFVQSLMGRETPAGVANAGDWFEVTEDRIDRNDPDCVWRLRQRQKLPPILEMWSPIRWVVVALKLQLPARTGQIRMSDSGESDYMRYENGAWVLNQGPLAFLSGISRQKWSQGLLSQVPATSGEDSVALYYNTNKTGDRLKFGKKKGQLCEWPELEKLHENPYPLIEKTRNWQEKYNPIKGRTRWADVPASKSHGAKHEETMAEYPDACFLFRGPEHIGEEHLPLSNGAIATAWELILKAFEDILAAKNITHPNGSRIVMFDPLTGTVVCPLHGLRVSLITHLIVDGGVKPDLMMKIVGHTRLIMTLYYTKYGVADIHQALASAAERLDANKDSRIADHLANAREAELRKLVVFNTEEWTTVLPFDPSQRSPVGWLYKHDGVCLAGGNTSPLDGLRSVPGCHNGGPLRFESQKDHLPVPGGSLNCCRCRWFAAGKEHGPGLVATLNNKLYHLRQEQEKALGYDQMVSALKTEKAKNEINGQSFDKMAALRNAQRLFDASMERLAGFAADVDSLLKILDRIKALPDAGEGGVALAAVGDQMSMNMILEEIDSELLQLSGVCLDVELYPDLDPGTAVFKFAQLLDAALACSGKPAHFLKMSEQDMLMYGNEFVRRLAYMCNPHSRLLGLRTVIDAIDRGQSIESLLGVSLDELLPTPRQDAATSAHAVPMRINRSRNAK